MSKHTFTVDYQFGDQSVLLKVGFFFYPLVSATGPTYACGGTPAEPAHVEIQSLEWSRDNKRTRSYEWNEIPHGPLFDLIAEDDYLQIELCDLVEAAAEEA